MIFWRAAAVLACVLMVSACGKPEPTVEEKVLMSSFVSMVGAGEYDRACNGGKITTTPPGEDNVYWYANQQTIVALLAAPLRVRYPKATVEQTVQRLLTVQEKIQAQAQNVLETKGCDSEEATRMSRALKVFTTLPPWQFQGTIAAEVEKQGGTMTELTEEQNRISPSERKALESPKVD